MQNTNPQIESVASLIEDAKETMENAGIGMKEGNHVLDTLFKFQRQIFAHEQEIKALREQLEGDKE